MKRSVPSSAAFRLCLLLFLALLPATMPRPIPAAPRLAGSGLARWKISWTNSTLKYGTYTYGPVTWHENHVATEHGVGIFSATSVASNGWKGDASILSLETQYRNVEDSTGHCQGPPFGTWHDHHEDWFTNPGQHDHSTLANVTFPFPGQLPDGNWQLHEPYEITQHGFMWDSFIVNDDADCGSHSVYSGAGTSGNGQVYGMEILAGNADVTRFTVFDAWDIQDRYPFPPTHITRSITAERLDVANPHLSLDSELLDRSIFLDQVPVDDRFDAKVDWGKASGGHVDFHLGPPLQEDSGDTAATDIPDQVDVGAQGVGIKQLTAQAFPDAGKPSNIETKAVVVAPPPAWCGSSKLILAAKKSTSVDYTCSYAWPDPAFEAKIDPVPAAVPFFGGSALGIKKTQLSAEMDLKSTGEGSIEGKAQTGFEAMGSPPIMGSVKLHGDLKLTADGVTIPAGGVDFTISGKLKKEEGLLNAIPTLTPVMTTIDKVSPAASAFLKEHAKVTLELEPKIVLGFNFVDKAGQMVFKNATLKPAVGIKLVAELKIVDKFATAKVSVGGAASLTVQVPSPYFKGVDLKFTAGAEIELGVWTVGAEAEWSYSSGGSHPADAPPNPPWRLIDRGYLQAPDYARWTGVATNTQGFVDQQVAYNVFPAAHPALAAGPGGDQYLVWSHDTDRPTDVSYRGALNGQELMFAKGGSNGWANQPVQLTSDDRADLNPQAVTLADGRVLVLWQRVDSATPSDLNNDPKGYLSHFQVAAGTFNPNDGAPTLTPLQLSTSGSLNYRQQVGALANGAVAVWVNNAANQVLGDATHPETIEAATYDAGTGTWSTPVTVASNVTGLVHLQLATNGSHGALVYEVDTDGDLSTNGDRELYYALYENGAWHAPNRLTTNTVPDEEPHLVLTDAGGPLLVWQQNGHWLFLATSWTNTPGPLPFSVEAGQANWDLVRGTDNSAALVWQQLDGNDTAIGYALWDASTGSWSMPQGITPPIGTHTAEGSSALVAQVAPVLETGVPGVQDALVYAYQLASVQPVTRTVEGVAVPNQPQLGPQTLRVGRLPLTANLHLTASDVQATPAAAKPGDPVIIRAAVHNTGQRGIPGAVANLVTQPVAGSTQETVVVTQTLALLPGGGTVTATFNLTRPALADRQYLVKVSAPQGMVESDTTDNEAPVGMDVVGSAVPTIYTPDGALLGLTITTTTGLPPAGSGQAMLTLDRQDGPQLEQASVVFPITPTATVTVTTWLPTSAVGPGHHQLFWTIDPSGALGERSDNRRVVATSVDLLPDLTTDGSLIDWSSAPGSSTFYRVPVQNTGAYTSTGGVLALYDGVPGTTTTHTLLRQPLPTLRSGATAVLSGTLSLAGLPAATTGLQGFYVVLDPDNVVAEITKNNNTAIAGNVGGSAGVSNGSVYLPLVRRN